MALERVQNYATGVHMSVFTDSIASHLEFLGYSIEPTEDERFHARHGSKPNFLAREFRGGCLITAWWDVNEAGADDREGLLEAVNRMNAGAAVARYYIDSDNDFAAEAYYQSPYDRVTFGQFMDLWDHDFANVLEAGMNSFLS